jgi:ABC-type hemin transport system ATPase subunit
VVMHDLELAFQLFERIVLMDKGRIVANGRADEIVHDKRLDDVFGVKFKRVGGPGNVSLQIASIE